MATQVLGVVGTAVGTTMGGSIGGFIGGQIGMGIGARFDGPDKRHYEGARLEELAVQTSTYGKAVPKVWGSVRLAGNVIWSRPIKELVTTTTVRSGGKGGGGRRSQTTQTEYSYFVTLAIAVCEGEITRIDRVWADAKLLDLSLGTYRLYTGSEAQLPDPLIESYEGVGSTPGYRGMAYVVIEDFPLAEYGNRIPNFSFEVTRRVSQRDVDEDAAESLVRSVMLIPGSGEFVYETQAIYKTSGEDAGGNWVQTGFETPLNCHTPEGKANVLVALDQMQQTFPNLEWVGVVVNWFGTSMDIANCEIWPSVEYKVKSQTAPLQWSAGGYTRATARQIGSDDGNLRYGGTPSDASVVHLCELLRARGLKVFLYPMMLMDVAGKPWRGLLSGNAASVANFFTRTRGYRAFILHYANLTAGKIDAFAIGSEMRDLTKITSSTGVFPVVGRLVTLAEDVKAILGHGVVVTYAADWSEYHHTDNGWYHLDPLWASGAIDVVGIDAYFPLTDAVQTGYDLEDVRAGWFRGEGYDWYYADEARTEQLPLAPEWAWKNIHYWWEHAHTNPDGAPTAWVPESKPIWFTEYGFASVDGCANQPNIFVDASTAESGYPRHSRGRVDFMAQRTAIAATEKAWQGSSMVPRRFLWSWDARPYPYWPDLREYWADGDSWVTGHWVQGKLGCSHVAPAVEEIAVAAGCTVAQLELGEVQAMLDGFVLAERTSARAAIEQLMQAFFFTLRERDGTLRALPRKADALASIAASECIPMQEGGRHIAYQIERVEDLLLPETVEVHAMNRLQRYATHVQSAWRGGQGANEVSALRLAVVMSAAHGRAVAETLLTDRWAERSSVSMQLPMRYAALEPGDVVQLLDGAQALRLRLVRVQVGRPGLVRVKAVIDASEAWDGYIAPSIGGAGDAVMPPATTWIEVLDIPALETDAADALMVRLAVAGSNRQWQGASIMRVGTGGEEELLATTTRAATMGGCLHALGVGSAQRIDHLHTLDVALLGEGELSSVGEAGILLGANRALVGDEIIHFATAELQGPGVYRLSGLLRGQSGTEHAITTHVAGERFVLLDDALVPLNLPMQALGQSWTLRVVTHGMLLSQGTEVAGAVAGQALMPYAPVRLRATRDGTGDVTFAWTRRARIDNGLRDLVDIPLMEQEERYEIRVLNGAAVVRSWQTNTATQLYTHAQQLTDFGFLNNSYSVEVVQYSALVGPGKMAAENLSVQ